jgi:4-hydroxyphenylacetate 3-monooxygenase
VDDLVADQAAIAEWARLTYGWMGRSPDYKAAFLATYGPNADYYAPYADNARRWYKEAQEKVFFMNHTLVNPPVDRNREIHEVEDVFIHAVKETSEGVVVTGAKMVATGSAFSNYNFVSYHGSTPIKKDEYAISFFAPMNQQGTKLICRPSYEYMAATVGSPFDYPLSSRFDENDAVLVFEEALIPWENFLIYGNLETGTLDFRGIQASIGEIIAWRNTFWALTDAMCHNPVPSANGSVLPNIEAASAYRILSAQAYPIIKGIIENQTGGALIVHPSSSRDWKNPELRPYLDQFYRGSNGYTALDKIKLVKLLWDAIGSEFGGRHELYERSYSGSHELTKLECYWMANGDGTVAKMKGFAEQCMAEYDLDGWTVPDLINPDDVSILGK